MWWQRPFEAVFDRWDRTPVLIRWLTFPFVVAIWIPYACITIPAIVVSFATHHREVPAIKDMSRDELRDWAEGLVARLDVLGANNPQARDVIDPLRKEARKLLACLAAEVPSEREADGVAKAIISTLATWKGIPASEVAWLAKHVEKWANRQSDA